MPRRPSAPASPSLSIRALEHLRRIVHAIHSQSAAIEAATGLTGPQFWALREVARARDGITLGELARRLALHKANAGRLADRLARKRLVTRETPPDDRRVVLVRVTAAGLRKAEVHVSAPPQAHLLISLEGLPPSELADIEDALGRLVHLLGAEGQAASPLFEGRMLDEAADLGSDRPEPRARRSGRSRLGRSGGRGRK